MLKLDPSPRECVTCVTCMIPLSRQRSVLDPAQRSPTRSLAVLLKSAGSAFYKYFIFVVKYQGVSLGEPSYRATASNVVPSYSTESLHWPGTPCIQSVCGRFSAYSSAWKSMIFQVMLRATMGLSPYRWQLFRSVRQCNYSHGAVRFFVIL